MLVQVFTNTIVNTTLTSHQSPSKRKRPATAAMNAALSTGPASPAPALPALPLPTVKNTNSASRLMVKPNVARALDMAKLATCAA